MHTSLVRPKKPAVATVPQISILLDQHPKTVYDLAVRQALPIKTFRSGRRIFASRHDLEQLLGAEAVSAVLDTADELEPAIAS